MKAALVLPVHNAEAYLGACLDSILAQTLADLAVVAVEDGSTDGSGAVLERYAARDARITVIRQGKAGVCSARNAALDLIEKRIRPEFIGFCDGDDWIEPGMLESMAEAIESRRADAAVCGFRRAFRSRTTMPAGEGRPVEVIGRADFVERIFGAGRWRGTMVSGGMLPVTLWKSAVLEGLRFPPGLKAKEDELFSLCAAERLKTAVVLWEPFYHYRQRNGGSRSVPMEEKWEGRRLALDVAGRISPEARTTAAAALVGDIFTVFKNAPTPGNRRVLEDHLGTLDEAERVGKIRASTAFMYRMHCRSPFFSRLWFRFRGKKAPRDRLADGFD